MTANEIQGWMRKRELAWLRKVAANCNLVVEIGTWMGKSTFAMGEAVNGKVITIDTFKMDGVPIRRYYTSREAQKQVAADPDWIYHKCLENLSELIEKGKVRVIKGDSKEVIKTLDCIRGLVDMVFIDGSHDYESVKADIINYRPLLRKGGLLCGHDFSHQVKDAVVELVPRYVVARSTSIWVSVANGDISGN